MTRILHVTDFYLPRVGGIELHVDTLARRQRQLGHDVDILTSAPADLSAPVDPGWVRRTSGTALTATGRSFAGRRQVGAVLESGAYDAVHAHVSIVSPLALAAAHQAATLGTPTVVTVHSLWSRLGPVPSVVSSMLRMRTWPVVWSAVSDVAAASVQRTLGPTALVEAVPNGVDPEAWRPLAPPPPGEPTIVCVGRLARRKRPLPFLRMLRQLRSSLPADQRFRVLIIGEGPDRPAMEDFLRAHRMTAWVRLLGRLDPASIRDVFSQSHLYVAPAELESFGIAALEARCAGLPVVASSHGGVGQFITHGVDGLLVSSDREMVGAMRTLVQEPTLRQAIARHNRTVPPAATWDAVLDGCARLYALAGAPDSLVAVPEGRHPGGRLLV